MKNNKSKAVFDFFQMHARNETKFTIEELRILGGWPTSETPRTYISKQWKDFLQKVGKNEYSVRKDILSVDEAEFEKNFSQRRKSVAEYNRVMHENFIQYEFLLPLSKEAKLRRALDELFYKDTLINRIEEAGLENITQIIQREENESDSQLKERIAKVVSGYFGGYSISHLNGRFRASEIVEIKEAANYLSQNKRYIIDETTALVRFVIPCETSQKDFSEDFSSIIKALKNSESPAVEDLDKEVNKIRCLFFFFFVESIVKKILDEDEIWLIETGRGSQRLYRWQKKS